jgi:signal peptidase I
MIADIRLPQREYKIFRGKRDATFQTLGVNAYAAVEYSHMNDPVMQHDVSPENSKGSDRSIILYTVLAIAIALVVRVFVAAPYLVSGPSMEPTFHNFDYLIVQKLSACMPFTQNDCIDFGNPSRGDIVIFKLPQNPNETLIKRVVGVPGDTVSLSGNAVTVSNAAHPDGVTLAEPYLSPADLGGATGMQVTLGSGQYFVLGDNRVVSYDSRLWGVLPRQDIIGVVLLRLYPFNQIAFAPGEARYSGL